MELQNCRGRVVLLFTLIVHTCASGVVIMLLWSSSRWLMVETLVHDERRLDLPTHSFMFEYPSARIEADKNEMRYLFYCLFPLSKRG